MRLDLVLQEMAFLDSAAWHAVSAGPLNSSKNQHTINRGETDSQLVGDGGAEVFDFYDALIDSLISEIDRLLGKDA